MKPFPINDFTDAAAQRAYERATEDRRATTDPEEMMRQKRAADEQREQVRKSGPLLSAACTYLALAQQNTTVGSADAEKFFHFAANAFRDLGLLQRAAQCYYNSALLGYQKYQANRLGDAVFAKRSAGRAKSLFTEIGEDEHSDSAHVLQQDIKRAEFRGNRNYLLTLIFFLWERISGYGTSPVRWAQSLGVSIVVFAVVYAILLRTCDIAITVDAIDRSGIALWTSSLYFSIGNLLQFGTLGLLTPKTALAQLIFMLHAIVAFILIGTGATFLSRR